MPYLSAEKRNCRGRSYTIELVFNSGPGAHESWRRDLGALGPLLNTNSIVHLHMVATWTRGQ